MAEIKLIQDNNLEDTWVSVAVMTEKETMMILSKK